jgi:hypothetical protein
MAGNTFTAEEQALLDAAPSGFTQRQIPLGEYPYVNVETTQSGHTFVKDDTPGSEQVSTIHRTGTFTTMYPDGSQVNKIMGNGIEIIEKDKKVSIKGACQVVIHGDVNMTINGSKTERIKGSLYQEIQGDYNQLVLGKYTVTSQKDMDICAGSTSGTIRIIAGNGIDLTGDLDVDGGITAEDILSNGAINAGTGIHAGHIKSANPYAGISTIGGIAVGFPGPTIPGVVTATAKVEAPLIMGIQTFDIMGPMSLIRTIYDGHVHPGVRPGPGSTAPPIPLM